MSRSKNPRSKPAGRPKKRVAAANQPVGEPMLRIVGGSLRGRKLRYSGDPLVRPMKERTREAVFNLIGPAIKGTHAIDLFAGTGAIGLEAISRGATRATLIERHFPTARIIRENADSLGVQDQVELVRADSFAWAKLNQRENPLTPGRHTRIDADLPWVVFCCPPYSLFHNRWSDLNGLMQQLRSGAPAKSIFLFESDLDFDVAKLPDAESWDVRCYAPAQVAILRS